MQSAKRKLLWRAAGSCLISVGFGLAALVPAQAEEGNLEQAAKSTGRVIGTAARDIGQGAKRVGKTVGNAAKEGGREFRKAIKGESGKSSD